MKGIKTATPYLRRWMPSPGFWKLPDLATAWAGTRRTMLVPKVLDLGCGDGRNSEYLRNLGCSVVSYDMRPDYAQAMKSAWVAGRDDIPEIGPFDLVLCQYLLMFLSDDEIYRLLLEIERVVRGISGGAGYALFELQDVKSGRHVRLSRIIDFFLDSSHLTKRQRKHRGRWTVFHQAKDRCVLRHTNASESKIFLF